jgi:outer membrane protein TolC
MQPSGRSDKCPSATGQYARPKHYTVRRARQHRSAEGGRPNGTSGLRRLPADARPHGDALLSNARDRARPPNRLEAELALALPIYDGGLRYGQEHERRARAGEAHLKVEDTVRRVRSEVRTAYDEVAIADLALGQAEQSARFAAKALALAVAAYRGGATNNLDVIDAERRARDSETQEAVAEDAAREARLDLLAATGKFP